MIKVFISHKQEDSYVARKIANELDALSIPYYLDVLDNNTTRSGKALIDHIKEKLNDCTDIIVIMSDSTKLSQWVPFEVGMSAQRDMPTATYLQQHVSLPDFLAYWPRLKQPSDIKTYIITRMDVQREYKNRSFYGSFDLNQTQTTRFYDVLKQRL